MSLRKTMALGASAALALTGTGASIAGAFSGAAGEPVAHDAASAVEATAEQSAAWQKTDVVTLDLVEGSFTFTQSAVAANEEIARNMSAAQYLCGARPAGEASSIAAEDWQISVGGAVENPYTATYQQFVESEQVQQVLMGCSCAGNPADGRASVNAEVTGVSLLTMLDIAGADASANTVVVTSADGYEVALPLSYVASRYCPIVFDVNGSPIAESMGGANQLWLGSTAASYFARDVVAITVECRETAPASPSSDEAREAYENLPNVGIMLGGEVA